MIIFSSAAASYKWHCQKPLKNTTYSTLRLWQKHWAVIILWQHLTGNLPLTWQTYHSHLWHHKELLSRNVFSTSSFLISGFWLGCVGVTDGLEVHQWLCILWELQQSNAETHQSVRSRSRTPTLRLGPSSCWRPGLPGRSRSSRWGWWHRQDPSELLVGTMTHLRDRRAFFFFFFNHRYFSPGSHVYGCPEGGKVTGTCPSPSPPPPPPPPGGCVCSGSSGQVGSCSVFHILQVQHFPTVRNSKKGV